MSADFWAGYISGAAGIVIGNPLDLLKVRLQAGEVLAASSPQSLTYQFESASALVKGVTAPLLGYGALNALLFVSYNRSLRLLDPSIDDLTHLAQVNLFKIWIAGALGGLATWIVSAPTELIKCRAQTSRAPRSSWTIAREAWRSNGVRGLYCGGSITSVRDAVGYGFYFWSYELSKRCMTLENETQRQEQVKVLLCGGLAGIVTWASVFPLDVIKTRVQTQAIHREPDQQSLLLASQQGSSRFPAPRGALALAREAYATEGISIFFRGLGICSIRAFLVNAVQWTLYEWVMRALKQP